MKKATTWSAFWEGVVNTARSAGAVDADLAVLSSNARHMMISAGWCDVKNDIEFVSERDEANATATVCDFLAEQTPVVMASRVRSNRVIRAGYEVSPSQVLTAHALEAGTFMPTENAAAIAPLPGLADVGTKCTRCGGPMAVVGLVNDKSAVYCVKDRIVLPL